MGTSIAQFDVFLDESGDFRETSTAAAERAQTSNGRVPSQLVGLLVPRGQLTEESAKHLLQEACSLAGVNYTWNFHTTHLNRQDVDRVLALVLPRLDERMWQPLRLVNREGVKFGDRITAYTNMVAELALRIFQNLRVRGLKDVELHFHCAEVWDPDAQKHFEASQYRERLDEVVARAAIRAGQAENQRRWSIRSIRLGKGKIEPEIHLCDLLSNASWNHFSKLSDRTARALEQAFGRYDMTLQIQEDLDRVDSLAACGSTGLALVHTAERILDRTTPEHLRTELTRRLGPLLGDLAAIGAPARDVQLEAISMFLEQTIQWDRDLELGRRKADWLLGKVAMPLQTLLPESERPEVAWFEAALHLHILVACNHLGDLDGARHASLELSRLEEGLAERWERLDLFLQIQINSAVHQTDCRELPKALRNAARVADFHGQLSSLFSAAMPGAFGQQIRARRCGEALGTAMQAALFAGLTDPTQFEVARAFGDRALAEFDKAADRARQHQYRCQLETLAGDAAAARHALVRAFDLSDSSARSITAKIEQLSPGSPGAGFALLHWLRFGSMVHQLREGAAEAASFREAWAQSRLPEDPWCTEDRREHPGPSILRYLGEIHLAAGKWPEALNCLRRLRSSALSQPGGYPLLRLPLVGLQTSAVATIAGTEPHRARQLADNRDKTAPGLVQLLSQLKERLSDHSQWVELLDGWNDPLMALRSGAVSRQTMEQLRGLARLLVF